MTTRKKTKAPAVAVVAPQNRNEAAQAVARIGELNRQVARREADMNDAIAQLKTAAEADAAPLQAEIRGLTIGLQAWCAANRAELTNGNKVKFADLGTGKVSWRSLPAKVTLTGVEAVLDACKRLGLQRFIRTKEEPNKEAMLAEPDVARTVAGIKIGSAGEEFIVEPFEAEISAQAAAS